MTVKQGNMPAIHRLLPLTRARNELDAPNTEGNTLLHMAILFRRKLVVPVLLDAGVGSFSTENEDGLTPLELALLYRLEDCFQRLWRARYGAHMPIVNLRVRVLEAWRTHVGSRKHSSICFANFSQVRDFAHMVGRYRGRKVFNHTDQKGYTLLGAACRVRHRGAALALLMAGADPNAGDCCPLSCLASSHQNEYLSEALVKRAGANPGTSDSQGNTPLHYISEAKTISKLVTYSLWGRYQRP